MPSDETLLSVLHDVADAVHTALAGVQDWAPPGQRKGQYAIDLVADEAALGLLERAGLGVLSEESGLQHEDRPLLAVIDPVDGSTNASRRIPWYATSICVVDQDGPRVALVANQANGVRYEAVRNGGVRVHGIATGRPSGTEALSDALVLVSGYPTRHLGWRQFRVLGAAALDLCAVATGQADAYLDATRNAHGPWDYLGALLVCHEAGVPIVDAAGRDLVARGHADRRTPVAAATPALLSELLAVFDVDQ